MHQVQTAVLQDASLSTRWRRTSKKGIKAAGIKAAVYLLLDGARHLQEQLLLPNGV